MFELLSSQITLTIKTSDVIYRWVVWFVDEGAEVRELRLQEEEVESWKSDFIFAADVNQWEIFLDHLIPHQRV